MDHDTAGVLCLVYSSESPYKIKVLHTIYKILWVLMCKARLPKSFSPQHIQCGTTGKCTLHLVWGTQTCLRQNKNGLILFMRIYGFFNTKPVYPRVSHYHTYNVGQLGITPYVSTGERVYRRSRMSTSPCGRKCHGYGPEHVLCSQKSTFPNEGIKVVPKAPLRGVNTSISRTRISKPNPLFKR